MDDGEGMQQEVEAIPKKLIDAFACLEYKVMH
jgi:hypothetical protein